MNDFPVFPKSASGKEGRWSWEESTARSLQQFGRNTDTNNLIVEQYTETGVGQYIGPMGETLIGYKKHDVAIHNPYNQIDYRFDYDQPIENGAVSVSSADGLVTLTSGAAGTPVTADRTDITADSTAVTADAVGISNIHLASRRLVRGLPGSSLFAEFRLARKSLDGQAYIGPMTMDYDGLFVRVDGTGLYFGYRRKGIDTEQAVDTTGIDLSQLNSFRISYGDSGFSRPFLMIVRDGNYDRISTIETDGTIDFSYLINSSLPISAYAENGMVIDTCGWSGGHIGNGGNEGVRAFFWPVDVIVNGTADEQGVVALTGTDVKTVGIFRGKDQINGLPNMTEGILLSLEVSVLPETIAADGELIVQVIGNPTLSGTPTYTDVDASSAFEFDSSPTTGASVSYASDGVVIIQETLTYAAAQGNTPATVTLTSDQARLIGAVGGAGDVFCIIAKNRGGGNLKIRHSLRWVEYF